MYNCVNVSLPLIIFFALKSTYSDNKIASPAFFGLIFAWHILFQSFSFNLPKYIRRCPLLSKSSHYTTLLLWKIYINACFHYVKGICGRFFLLWKKSVLYWCRSFIKAKWCNVNFQKTADIFPFGPFSLQKVS